MKAVGLTVNGLPVIETVEPRTHLADLLRERLGLTGTHLRCEQGACGACTLLIDGQPVRSCITYAVLCEGAQITTIEGLEDDPVMTALRQAFTAEHGLQCGFCTPGMLITARDIVTRLPAADQRRVRLELSGNLCRCPDMSASYAPFAASWSNVAPALSPRWRWSRGGLVRWDRAMAGRSPAWLRCRLLQPSAATRPPLSARAIWVWREKSPTLKSASLSSSRDRSARCGTSSPRPNAWSRACPEPRSAARAAT